MINPRHTTTPPQASGTGKTSMLTMVLGELTALAATEMRHADHALLQAECRNPDTAQLARTDLAVTLHQLADRITGQPTVGPDLPAAPGAPQGEYRRAVHALHRQAQHDPATAADGWRELTTTLHQAADTTELIPTRAHR